MNSFDPSPGAVPGTGLLGLSQRIPPSNLAAEQALLGALLANNKAFERVGEYLAPDHFADPVHGRIFHAIKRRVEAGQLADAVTLRADFEHSGLLDEVGGPAYLAQLLSAMVGVINAGEYGQRNWTPRGNWNPRNRLCLNWRKKAARVRGASLLLSAH